MNDMQWKSVIFSYGKYSVRTKTHSIHFYTNRVIKLPITEQAKQQKWNTILTVAKNNRFPLHIIHNLKKQTNN